MKNKTRKSTALISLVLVPMNLLGLGFTGCDSRDESTTFTGGPDTGQAATGDFGGAGDFETSPNDPFTLNSVPPSAPPPTTQPAPVALAQSPFAEQAPNAAQEALAQNMGGGSGTGTSSSSGYRSGGYHGGGFMFLPIPFRTGYSPMYRPTYRPSYGTAFRPGYAPGRPGYSPGGAGVSRSTPGNQASRSQSPTVNRGGFGSSGRSASSGSGS